MKTCHAPKPVLPRIGLSTVVLVQAVAALLAAQQSPLPPQPTSRPVAADTVGLLGRYAGTLTGLRGPARAVIDAHGHIYIAQRDGACVGVFDRAGVPLRTIGRRGTRPGEFLEPSGIALAGSGDVVVADARLNRISVFRPTGELVRTFGRFGRGEGELIAPEGLSAQGDRICVADTGNCRLQVFTLDGRVERVLGEFGSDAGPIGRPVSVAGSNGEAFFAADADLDRIASFDGAGRRLGAFGMSGPFAGLLLEPAGVALHGEFVYVAERFNHRVQVFDAAGKAQYQWGLHAYRPREGEGRLHYPSDVAIAPDGSFAAVCEAFEDRVQLFERMPPGQKPPQNPFIGLDPSGGSHFTPWADVGGRFLATAELETDKVALYDASREEPIMVTSIGQRGTAPGQFIRPSGLCLDVRQSTLYVADAGNRRLCAFSLSLPKAGELRFVPDMASLKRAVRFDVLRQEDARLATLPVFEPAALARGGQRLYAADGRTGTILAFDFNLALKEVWTDPDAAERGPRGIVDLAVSTDGDTLYAADAAHGRILALDREGRTRFSWTFDAGASPVRPAGLCVLRDAVYVCDAANHRVLRLDADGAVQRTFGRGGIGAGELFRPAAIRPLGDDELLVIDYGNHRGAIFDRDGQFRRVFGSRLFTEPARRETRTPVKQP